VITRGWHAVIAVLVLAALVIQVVIAVRASATPSGHAVGTLAGTNLAGRLLRTVSFFTIQSNILSGVLSAQLAREPVRDGARWRIARLDALFGITVTGIVYSTVLARIHEPKGWEQVSTNTVVHYVVPIMMVLGWLLFGPRPRIAISTLRWSLLWPVLYFGYVLVLGKATGWYPYPFVDVASQGYGRVLVNAVLVTLVLGAVAGLYLFGDRKLRPAPPRTA
jgi:uncharacterized membrane protein